MNGVVELRALTKGNRLRDRNLLRFIREPHYLKCVSTPRQELFMVVGWSNKSVASVSVRSGRVSLNLEKCSCKQIKREDWEEPQIVL